MCQADKLHQENVAREEQMKIPNKLNGKRMVEQNPFEKAIPPSLEISNLPVVSPDRLPKEGVEQHRKIQLMSW
jgi:hypothetical protein